MILNLHNIKVNAGDRVAAIATLRRFIGPTKAKTGCLKCSLYSHVDNDDDLLLIEKWSSVEQLSQHIQSDHYQTFLAAIELACEKPTVEYHRISATDGLEFIETIRAT